MRENLFARLEINDGLGVPQYGDDVTDACDAHLKSCTKVRDLHYATTSSQNVNKPPADIPCLAPIAYSLKFGSSRRCVRNCRIAIAVCLKE